MTTPAYVAVIGAGPAGIATAVQLKRSGFESLLFEKRAAGGLLRNAHWVENYPGFPNGISGPALAAHMNTHLDVLNIPILSEEVVQLDFDENKTIFKILTGANEYVASRVVVASGTSPCRLRQAEGLAGHLERKVFYEVDAIRDAENKHVVIVGAGDAAFDYALNLASTASNRITIIYRGVEIKALPLLRAKVQKTSNITLLDQSEIVTIGEGEEDKLRLEVQISGRQTVIACDYVLAAVGREAEKYYYSHRLMDLEEELIARDLLLPVGDVTNGLFRQASIAVGNGVEAAMRVCRSIKE